MPPKQRITREMIMERAFDMFCREGMDVVNARSVAKALNCSTQPIFSYYTGMQELRGVLDAKAQEMFEAQVLSMAQGDSRLTDVCAAFVRFSCEHPHVYKRLYDCVCEDNQRLQALAPASAALTAKVAQQEDVSEEKAALICRETAIYAVGLATAAMINTELFGDAHAKLEKAYRSILAAQA